MTNDQYRISFRDRLDRSPLILAGPILRHTSSTSVTVWFALKKPCRVTLEVYATAEDGNLIAASILSGERSTIALGQYLHVVAVTATSPSGDRLHSGQIYAYDISCQPHSQGDRQTLQQALTSSSFPVVPISYFQHQLPTFVLPPEDLDSLRIVHGSCRKPHGKGYDALPILDSAIEQSASVPDFRPQQLFLTGDQIYGDDVADPLLWALTQTGDLLLGWEEQLPSSPPLKAKQIEPGQRSKFVEEQAGFTAGLQEKPEYAKSHLLSLGEYCTIYLFALSQVFWSQPLPSGREICRDKQAAKQWDRELKELHHLARALWKVRRALANISTYTIFDDHDVSDDWYLNQAWCLRVLGKPLGRRAVINALLAYAVFQGWGNTPEQFQPGQAGAKLLEAASNWSKSAGKDENAEREIARYLGLPKTDPITDLPTMLLEGEVFILDRSPDAIAWHYTVTSASHEVIVLDTRTWRGYPAKQNPLAPPSLLCPSAFKQQLQAPLQQSDRNKIQATFIVAPTNLFSLHAIDWIQRWHLKQRKVFDSDVGDAWNLNTHALAEFLSVLFAERDKAIVLSGDIHYSAAIRLNYRSQHDSQRRFLTQLTASAIDNSELKTQIVHTKIKSMLLPEHKRYWLGQTNPPQMKEVKTLASSTSSDWECYLEWIPRQPIQMPEWGKTVPWLRGDGQKSTWRDWLLDSIRWIWQNRWLQEGNEVVGLNNIGFVRLVWSEISNERKVIQDIYWYTSWGRKRIVYSRFSVPLAESFDRK
jgi:hypothetical protein